MNEVKSFENQQLVTIANCILLDSQIKEAKIQLDEQKASLLAAMEKNGIKSIENDFFKVTIVAASSSTSIDLKAFQKEEPVEHAQLLEDYPKVTNRKPSLRIKAKFE